MSHFLGIDGGGTKTSFMLVSAETGLVQQDTLPGCFYEQYGIEGFREVMRRGLELALQSVNQADITGVCAGLPGLGEDREMDGQMLAAMDEVFGFTSCLCVNDVEVGWAGSLAMKPGVNIVAGTGSIFFGMTENGRSMRSGGWGDILGDEGSAYWLGRLGLSLFCKEADGRLPRGPIYDRFKQRLALERDLDLIAYGYRELNTQRDKVAELQKTLCEAAIDGDPYAVQAYEMAADELAMGVRAVVDGLDMTGRGPIDVSYSGGTFKAGAVLLDPLKKKLEGMDARLVNPIYSPVVGAVLLAARHAGFPYEPLFNFSFQAAR